MGNFGQGRNGAYPCKLVQEFLKFDIIVRVIGIFEEAIVHDTSVQVVDIYTAKNLQYKHNYTIIYEAYISHLRSCGIALVLAAYTCL